MQLYITIEKKLEAKYPILSSPFLFPKTEPKLRETVFLKVLGS